MVHVKEDTQKNVCAVTFDWSESCRNVYKTFTVHINGKKSNIVGLKKFIDNVDNMPDILSAKTYFWSPASSASQRRSNEKRRNNEVAAWLITENFKMEN